MPVHKNVPVQPSTEWMDLFLKVDLVPIFSIGPVIPLTLAFLNFSTSPANKDADPQLVAPYGRSRDSRYGDDCISRGAGVSGSISSSRRQVPQYARRQQQSRASCR